MTPLSIVLSCLSSVFIQVGIPPIPLVGWVLFKELSYHLRPTGLTGASVAPWVYVGVFFGILVPVYAMCKTRTGSFDVLGHADRFKMFWIDAVSNEAQVVYRIPTRDRSFEENVGDSVSQQNMTITAVDLAVAARLSGGRPFPATRAMVYGDPAYKPVLERQPYTCHPYSIRQSWHNYK